MYMIETINAVCGMLCNRYFIQKYVEVIDQGEMRL